MSPGWQSAPNLEALEARRLLSGPDGPLTPLYTPTSTNLLDAQNGPMANLGVQLVSIYADYTQGGANAANLQAEFPEVQFQNGLVGVQLKSLGGDFSQYVSQLTDVGMQLTSSSSYYGLVEGFLPINELPTVAELNQTQSGSATENPILYGGPEYQGEAYNEAETSLFADVARNEFNVDGTGVTIGVLSDSVSQYQGGLADSYKTGDLNPSMPVDVIADGPAGSTDEGRAMLENIHDVAPGASLAFATAVPNELTFANDINALASTAHASIIADDVSYFDEPFFQDGIVAQAVDNVTSQGVTYFGAAGNQANDGYLSTFRATNATVAGIGTGTFMNFDPSGGTNVELPITTDGNNAIVTFEYDQPYQTQEPAGSTATVSSDVYIYLLDSSGNVIVGAAAQNNNVAIQEPIQQFVIPSAGSYEIAIQVVSGPNPGHVEFINDNENVDLTVNQQYGSAGGTYYPSSFGHHTDPNTIGIGATPWWAPAPYLGQTPLGSEPFSSYGPGLYIFNADGTPMSSPELAMNPTVTAPDGGNTSFFSPGQIIDTSNPPFPGEPATPTNLAQNLPTFFGTSSATPNAAAVAALMEELVPNLTPAEVRAGLIASAATQPMNGATPGTWAADGGYGLINAVDALNAVDLLRVSSTSPANGSTVTTAPSVVQITFNKPVIFSTLSAADLTFTGSPNGVTVVVGAPIAVDNPTDPTIVDFPISLTKIPGVDANGRYTFTFQSPANGPVVTSEDDKSLVGTGTIAFTLADVTAPTIVNTTVSGRTITIQFSKALDPDTVTLGNIFVLTSNGASAPWPPNPSDLGSFTNLNSDPRATISYNPLTYTVTLDYSNLPQTEMPSADYAIVVLSSLTGTTGVTDEVGNPLDGYYTGSFPTTASPTGQPYDFIQNLGFESLQAPSITTFTMDPNSDTGIPDDQNTNISQPEFIGQVYVPFPGSIAGDQVYVQFSGDNGGSTTLAVGGGGRGYTGAYDVQATTDSSGVFTVTPTVPLPEGFQYAVALVVGQPDQPPLPGYSSSTNDAFRIDKTPPQITAASIPNVGNLPLPNGPLPNITDLNSLSSMTLTVVDPVNQASPVFDTPSAVQFDALDPSTASNVSNYSLVNTSTNTDESQYIATANFVPTAPSTDSTGTYITAYNGVINLTFNAGLPSGTYELVVHTHELQYPGLTDAAGNYLDDSAVPGEGTHDFIVNIAIETTPTYIRSIAMESSYTADGSSAIGGAQSYFELPPASGSNTRDNVAAPPTTFVIDLSEPIPFASYSPDIQLIRSANSSTSASDGDFGTLGEGGLAATGTGFTVVPGTTVTLYNYSIAADGTVTSTQVQAGGSGNRLVLQIAPGTTLPADDYRLYIPNQVDANGNNTEITDIFGNQLDGEFLGNPTSQSSPDFPGAPASADIVEYEDEQSDGTERLDDTSGDGVPGGAFMTGFTVVPYGNVVYARPGFVENPLLPNNAGLSTGTLADPYPVLAPEGDPNDAALNSNPTHNPNLGLNNPAYFQPGNFNLSYDYSGDGKYEQSALYAASQLAYNGPVVVVAEAGLPSRNPITGAVSEASFSLVAPAGNATGSGGSASVPFNTMLVMQAGSALKLQGASLFVQNQGSALQAQGTASDPVIFTSYNDASVGGATNNNPDTTPHAGDWGGIVFRNYNETIAGQDLTNFPVDGTLVGLNGGPAISGEQDAMSIINFATIRFGGGPVPIGSSNFYSGITLYNSRPMITNTSIANVGGAGGTEGAIGADFDSLREDDTARGPLIRSETVTSDSLNAIYLFAEPNGFVQPTSAMSYPANPSTLGGSLNYTLDEPLPVVVTAQLVVGQELLENTGGNVSYVTNRLYIQPGSLLKMDKGSGLDVVNGGASLNIGSRSYINGFDQDPGYNPDSAGFVEEGTSDPEVLFTTIFDDTAKTPFVPAINVLGEPTTPTLAPGMWGSVGIITGADVVINDTTFQYGGGAINTQRFTIDSQSVLSFLSDVAAPTFPVNDDTYDPADGTHAYITNDNFYNNFDAAMQIEPDGLLAGNPLTPLESGHPFFRGNVMVGNGIDGLDVVADRLYEDNPNTDWNYIGPIEAIAGSGYVNQDVSAVWDATDLTYVVEGTIVLGPEPFGFSLNGNNTIPTPNTATFTAEPSPTVTLTIQAALPGTLLADGETIPSPGQSVIVKMLSEETPYNDNSLTTPAASLLEGESAGAGFVAGVDNDVDPGSSDPLIDPGAYSEIRLLGIPGNQTTGQQRVPVIITSLRDDTVGTTVRGVQMYNILNSLPVYTGYINKGASLTTPAAGDGGYIYIGGNSMSEYDPTDPFDGSIISNADISYMTAVQVQGGGIVNTINDISGKAGAPSLTTADWWDQLTGYLDPVDQLNTAMSLTIEDSNLADFSEAAVFVHPDAAGAIDFDWTGATGGAATTPAPATRSSLIGQPVYLFMYNDTVSNSGQGVHINATTGDDATGTSVYQAVIENVTFYNDAYAIQTQSPAHVASPDNSYSSVEVLAMNDIFDGSANDAVDLDGTTIGSASQSGFSQLQYNLFYGNGTNVVSTTNDGDFEGNQGASYGNPDFVGPFAAGLDATAENFELEPNSPAIDAGRSEIGPVAGGNAVYSGTDLGVTNGELIGTRTNPTLLPVGEFPGKDDPFGEFGDFFEFTQFLNNLGFYDSRQIVTLPGTGEFTYPDQWQPVLTGTTNGFTGPSSNADTYDYQSYDGIRDILGYIRVPDPSVPGVGYGSNPFIDIGAYQYVNLHPPQVTAVTATETSTSSASGSTTIPFYTVGGEAGSNSTPLTIDVTFSEPIDPSTLTSSTVQLEELGVAPGTSQSFVNLAGKLSYDSATNTLIINLGAAGLNLPTDEYRLILYGSGAPVIANTQEIALDGEDLSDGDNPASGVQQPLPSGNGYPGGNFYDTFIINTVAPSIVPGSLQLSPSSDTNIVGDDITTSATPTFTGTISEPDPALVPLAGQTAILNIGIALDVNGTIETFFNPSQLPASLSSYAQYIRDDAGTGLTNANGNFSVTVGVDSANTGLVTNTSPLPDLFPIYNVGSSGVLSPLPGTDSGYYVAQAIAQDQSGNQSTPSAGVPFVVDDTPPTAQFVTPTSGQVITALNNGGVQFTIVTNKNIDLTHFTAASIQVTSAGPDGILGDADDVKIPINPSSISVTYLDAGIGGKGAEEISFTTEGTLTNDLYSVTLLNTGADAVRDIAGNVLAAPVTEDFAISIPSLSKNLFVGGAGYVTSPTAVIGTRENPYPTIDAAMSAATAGDIVAVLPGVYTENVTLKQFVRLFSVSASSSDTSVFATSTGDPLSTIIRSPATTGATSDITVTANGLLSFPGLSTEIAGFTIASSLVGDPALGTINPNAVGIFATNSNILIDKDYFADSGVGIYVTTTGSGAQTPQIENDVIVGNVDGVLLSDGGSTPSTTSPTSIINDDFAFNTIGLILQNTASTPLQAYVASNIFWQNNDGSNARNGYAIYSTNPGMISMRNNLFQGNGSSDSMTSDPTATDDLGNGFDPNALTSVVPDSQGNFVGNPSFVFPIDPRPGSDGPANLFVSSDFDLTANSAAIDNAWEATAITTDILGNSQVKVDDDGWGLPGFGPRDIGAYEFDGTGGEPVGGAFRIVTSSLVPVPGAQTAAGATLVTATSPTSITVTFSNWINPSSINATDLILSGSADNPAAPVHATSLTWIDGDTVEFNLSGPLSLPGTLDVSIAPNMIQSIYGQGNLAYTDNVVLQFGTPTPVGNPTPFPGSPTSPSPVSTTPTGNTPTTPTPTTPSPTVVSVITPAPAAAPVSVGKKHKHAHKPAKHAHVPVKHVAHKAVKHSEGKQHIIKKTTVHPKATTSLKLSVAGHLKKGK